MRRTPLWAAVTAVVIVGLAFGACGKSTKKKKAASTTTTEAVSTTTSTTAAPVVVTTKTNARLGRIFADANGMTLYTLTSGGKPVACNSTCAGVWPPLELPAGTTTPTGAPEVTGLGTVPGAGGTSQVTHDGLPLHRFSRDTTAADATGEGVQSFGGVWHVVKVAALTSTTARPGGVVTTPTTSRAVSTTSTTETTASTTSTTSRPGY